MFISYSNDKTCLKCDNKRYRWRVFCKECLKKIEIDSRAYRSHALRAGHRKYENLDWQKWNIIKFIQNRNLNIIDSYAKIIRSE